MPALNYKQCFAWLVETGAKRSTIRATRKVPIKSGDKLFHFTGMRTKTCRQLRTTICKSAKDIVIEDGQIFLRGARMEHSEVVALARKDGFATAADFFSFFNPGGEPFFGQLITW